ADGLARASGIVLPPAPRDPIRLLCLILVAPLAQELVLRGGLMPTIERLAGADRGRIAAVGLSSPGPLDADRGITFALPNLVGFDGFPLRDALAARLGLPVAFENDGIAAAVGEGAGCLTYPTLPTGIRVEVARGPDPAPTMTEEPR
ncbi:ROK family protein, partial [Mycobacterium tuberculosis]|nr:ROK family protein [Mycobacterium tuberculosis]